MENNIRKISLLLVLLFIAGCTSTGAAVSELEDSLVVLVLNDKNCPTCLTEPLISNVQKLFPGLEAEYVDVKSTEGKEYVSKYGIERVPAYVFDKEINQAESWNAHSALRDVFVESKGKFILTDQESGSFWYIDEDKRDAYAEEAGSQQWQLLTTPLTCAV